MTRLQFYRKRAKLTQKQLAELSGVNLKMIQKYETGEKSINRARVITVLELAAVLKVTANDLLE